MITDPADLAAKFNQLGDAMAGRQVATVQRSSEMVRTTVDRRIGSATGGDGILSGLGRGSKKKPKKIGVFVRLEAGPTGPQAFIRATGAIPLIEQDIEKHVVTSRYAKGVGYSKTNAKGNTIKGRSTRQSRQASVLFGLGSAGGGRRAVLHWGGVFARYTTASSKGRHPWRDGVNDARPLLGAIQAQEQRAAIRSVFH